MHGLTKLEIEQVFRNTPSVMRDHFPEEPRWRAIGRTTAGRYVFLVFMIREQKIRPISARFMHSKEIEHYENHK